MRALEELPSLTKNLIFPVVRVRPWLTAKTLVRAVERIKDSFGDRYFGLDLDAAWRNHGNTEAYAEFEELFDPEDGWRRYYEFVEREPFAVPVLRSGQDLQLAAQLAQIQRIDRGLFVRIDVEHPISVEQIATQCSDLEIENVVFVLDCGWRDHLLPLQAACTGLIRTIADISHNFEFVAAGGDFPSTGFDQGENFEIVGEERQLVEAVRRPLNDVDVIFGDWASTRAPSTDNQIRRSRPRLDMPTRTGWECWRSGTPDGTYADLAEIIVADRNLGQMSDFWGEQLIIATSEGDEPSIKSPATAAAVRINLHMIMQAHFDTGGGPDVTDELVVGEL